MAHKKKPHPEHTFREILQFYLIDCKTPLGKVIDIAIILVNLFICAIFVAETYPLSDTTKSLLWTLELIVVCFFIVEYIARLYASRNRIKHVFNIYSIIDLIAILPTLLVLFIPSTATSIGIVKIIRIFRVFRIFRFLRFISDPDFFFGKISWHLLRVIRLVITILIIFFVASGAFFYVESPVNPDVNTFEDAFYFTVVALTTVGFGDIIPISANGRRIVLLMIISGVILIPWQASQIVREWFYFSTRKQVVCPNCGLRYHDKDASHCKDCGHVIYQEYDGQ